MADLTRIHGKPPLRKRSAGPEVAGFGRANRFADRVADRLGETPAVRRDWGTWRKLVRLGLEAGARSVPLGTRCAPALLRGLIFGSKPGSKSGQAFSENALGT